jgi:hypothetical protein
MTSLRPGPPAFLRCPQVSGSDRISDHRCGRGQGHTASTGLSCTTDRLPRQPIAHPTASATCRAGGECPPSITAVVERTHPNSRVNQWYCHWRETAAVADYSALGPIVECGLTKRRGTLAVARTRQRGDAEAPRYRAPSSEPTSCIIDSRATQSSVTLRCWVVREFAHCELVGARLWREGSVRQTRSGQRHLLPH